MATTGGAIPEVVGNERRILVSELSGRSNIIAMTTKHDLQDDRKLMDKILGRVVEMENQGYTFEGASASIDIMLRRVTNGYQPLPARKKAASWVMVPMTPWPGLSMENGSASKGSSKTPS